MTCGDMHCPRGQGALAAGLMPSRWSLESETLLCAFIEPHRGSHSSPLTEVWGLQRCERLSSLFRSC